MNNFSDTVRETVRNSADIAAVVSEYVTLKTMGNALKGLCPFHSEKTPSFQVHRENQFFYCFGCHKGGDVFTFVQEIENVSFPEALHILAEKYGISVPTESGGDDRKFEDRRQLLETNERAAAYFHKMLGSEQTGAARQVLQKRRIDAAFIEKFQLGYAPKMGLAAVLKSKDPVGSGLFLKNDRGEVYDRFRHRLMFPIWNERGKTIAFGGRALADDDVKYLNSPETALYSKSSVLYALHFAREAAQKASRMVVVEGYFDCLSLHQNGIENVVASCGTALTQQQVGLMARYVPEVVMNYDPDAAGQSAMRRSIDLLLAKGLRIRILHLPEKLDPDDFIRKHGRDVYNRLLAKAPYFWQYLITEAAKQYDLSDPSLKANAVRDVLQVVGRIQDPVERREVAKAVAEGFKVPESLLFEQLNLTSGRHEPRPKVSTAQTVAKQALMGSEKQLIHWLLQNREAGRMIEPFLSSEILTGTWSFPVIAGLVRNPDRNIEQILGSTEDEQLRQEVRAAVFEPFGIVTAEQALASIEQLRGVQNDKRTKEIQERLKQESPELAKQSMKQLTDLAREKLRINTLKP